MTWYTFDKQPLAGETFLIKHANTAVYFGRVVDGKIKTCFVFQNIAYVTESEIANTGKPLSDWLKAQQPQGQNEIELLWSSFNWGNGDQGDLEGVVCLSVDEAKAVNDAIEWLCSTLEDYEREHDNTPALIEGWNQMDFLEHRIEQAEGK